MPTQGKDPCKREDIYGYQNKGSLEKEKKTLTAVVPPELMTSQKVFEDAVFEKLPIAQELRTMPSPSKKERPGQIGNSKILCRLEWKRRIKEIV